MSNHDGKQDRKDWRVLITGGSGFIGTHAVEFYRRAGAEVCNLDIGAPKLDEHREYWIEQDILDKGGVARVFEEFSPTHLLHLAARAELDEKVSVSDYVENIQGVEQVLAAAKASRSLEKAIVASTMYVCIPGYRPQSDEDYCPHTVYGESKVMTEKITRAAGLECAWCIVRPAVIWGPYHERLANEIFRIIKKGLYLHPGRSNAKKSYGYVENTVFQMDGLLSAPAAEVTGRTFYLADPQIGVYDWVAEFSRQLRDKPVRRAPMLLFRGLALTGDLLARIGYEHFPMTSFRLRNMTHDGCVDTSATESLVGPVPVDWREGVKRTVRWLEDREKLR